MMMPDAVAWVSRPCFFRKKYVSFVFRRFLPVFIVLPRMGRDVMLRAWNGEISLLIIFTGDLK
ncbi:MAG: hypothetical protein DRP83_07035 [Planctomycetota bacterium]|nr:MAG: hypothetical protein DRP83_07035 [Planctomycetota bacterium]